MNGFSDSGTKLMASALEVNNKLREVDLTNNRITSEGANAMTDMLYGNQKLKILRVTLLILLFR